MCTTVEITLKGEVNSLTGMVMNLVDLKECIKLAVMDPLDHRNLVKKKKKKKLQELEEQLLKY
jgi:6-pyruvoyl-tetrahydropterin synthase